MEARISMMTLGVRDMEAAVAFYETGLGLPRIDSPPTVAFFQLNGSWLGLYGWEELAEDATVPSTGEGFRGVALAHNLTSEAEVDALMAQAVAAGATMVKKPQSVFWGGYSGYFQDLDGHLWELAFNPHLWIGPEAGGA